jgi:hypothetical protein
MPKITTDSGQYLKKEDVPSPKLLTIKDVRQEAIKTGPDLTEKRWIMYFQEEEKGLVLNKSNIQRAKTVFKSENSDDWLGRKIVLYTDPNVEYAGKLVGGLRLRPSKQDMPADDVPF